MNDLDYIVKHLSLSERVAQLAEEAAELAQAALKYRRALDGVNPTPVTLVAIWTRKWRMCWPAWPA